MNIILKGQLAFMNKYFEVVGVTTFDKKHFKECGQREGIRMIPIEINRTISVAKDLITLIKLIRLFRVEKPSIVHTHTPKAGLLGMIASFIAGVPIRLHTVGGMPLVEARGLKKWILKFTEKITYKCAHGVYPNSFGLKEIIEKEGLTIPNKLKVIANGGTNGINVEFFKPDYNGEVKFTKMELREKYAIENDAFVLLFVGRIAIEKGIVELLDAFQQLKKKQERKVKLLLIGTYEIEYGELSDTQKKALEDDSDILMPGRFDDVRPFYAMSDLYVFPSYREGFPNSVLEAGAMGLPIIASNINGCNEIIGNGINGLLIPAKDANALYHEIEMIMNDNKLYELLANNARASIESRFRREYVWEELMKEYHHQIEERVGVS